MGERCRRIALGTLRFYQESARTSRPTLFLNDNERCGNSCFFHQMEGKYKSQPSFVSGCLEEIGSGNADTENMIMDCAALAYGGLSVYVFAQLTSDKLFCVLSYVRHIPPVIRSYSAGSDTVSAHQRLKLECLA